MRLRFAVPILLLPLCLHAQPPVTGGPPGRGRPEGVAPAPLPDSLLQTSLRVFLDCQGGVRGCDRDFFVQELNYVNWVRDRFDGDVHLLVTTLNAGNGGRELTINFIGQKKYLGKLDTLVVSTLPNDADDQVRRELLRTFQLGLAPFVARTPISSRLRIGLLAGVVPQRASPRNVKDPWNFWLYRIDGNIAASGEQLVKSLNLSGSVSAARTTEKWKINLAGTTGYNERDFKVFVSSTTVPGGRDTVPVVVLQRSAAANALIGRTMTNHLTLGLKASGGFSEILNQSLSMRVAPAIEYNVFDWTEATRRQLTALYSLGVNHYGYYSTTIFGEDNETRLNQTLLQ